tara:strand:- start:59 stop:994 length:936 start_codon:yes stop_codon:yes gene_type:complete
MKIIITGALGHIGSSLIRYLAKIKKFETIYLIDNFSAQRYCSLFNLPEDTSYTFLDLNLADCKIESIPDSDCIIHLAAKTDAAQSSKYEKEFYNNNLEATKKIIAYSKNKYSKLIFASSTSVYGPQSELIDENCSDEELKPQTPYADIKLKEEKMISEILNTKRSFIILRLGTIYGFSPGMRFHTAINKFCLQACMKKPLTVWRTAWEQRRPYLSLNDFNRAIEHIIHNNLFQNSIFNVLSHNKKVKEIIEIINKKILSNIEYVDHPIMNQLSYEISNKKFRDTNFQFLSNLEDDIYEIIDKMININSSKI